MGHLWLLCVKEERKKRMEGIGNGPKSIQEEKDLVGGVRNRIGQVAQREGARGFWNHEENDKGEGLENVRGI